MSDKLPVQQPLWTPDAERLSSCLLTEFMGRLKLHNVDGSDYNALYRWSVNNSDAFWEHVWNFCHVIGDRKGKTSSLGPAKFGLRIPARDTLWFTDATLNYAENLLAYGTDHPTEPAIWFSNESGQRTQLSWQQLTEQVSVIQQWLLHAGVGSGDVVSGYLPHIPHTVVAMLATTSLGAVWTSTSPDFGAQSVIERFGQVEPKVFFCCDGYRFNGKAFVMEDKNRQVIDSISSIKHVCRIRYLDQQTVRPAPDGATDWDSLQQHYSADALHFHRSQFNDPLFVLYSSGTTGKPKCIVHSVGGTLLNHLKEHQLHCDIQPRDRVFYYTTCGWMMWNWQVSALASGATLVIFDGSPVYPKPDALWQLANDVETTLFGTSAKYLETLQKLHYHPNEHFELAALKTLCSTGSVLYPQQFDFVYEHIKADLHLASISGGTDICGCFVLGNPISPVYRGECQAPGLAMDVKVFNDQGKAVLEQRGELVCRNSFPNQPIGFWNDNGERYHQAYWDRFSGAWNHGDDVMQNRTGGMVFFGRSDATLNPGGVRIGTAEIYQQVNQLDEVKDSIAVGRNQNGNETIVLFVQLSDDTELDESLKQRIKALLKTECSPRHVPSEIFAISEVPRTKSGKLVELAVKQTLHKQEVKNKGAIANPWVLDEVITYAK
ncbi:acetoacetate--CoA ligase [Vibrio hangzhouensis]|uniref:acetoacetate--CoA ligase n=1 Tax=Vibrio hangzhouensis TaxID=462991 RepID=UPI001C9770DE|nr:acetoacetate--CoA ligase [Vibrio hangzhouensis]MBY6196075.1 acetoacetate--CoA ligase [Vibrio hangzhouensis]